MMILTTRTQSATVTILGNLTLRLGRGARIGAMLEPGTVEAVGKDFRLGKSK